MSYSDDLEIDKFALDEELLRQPSLYMKYAEKSARAITERDRAKDRMEIVKAQVDSKIRGNPVRYTGSEKKPTEEQIRNLILCSEEYKEVQNEYVDCCETANILLSARMAFEQRRSSLEYLCKLFLSGYWADPKVTNEEREHIEKERDYLRQQNVSDYLAKDLEGKKKKPLRKT